GLSNGTYTVTPSKAGYTFSPASQTVTVNGAGISGVNFTSTLIPTFTISGTVSGAVASGVSLAPTRASGGPTPTDASGHYSFSGLSNGTYTITPSKAGYTFAPSSQTVTVSNANPPSVNFTSQIPAPALAIDANVSVLGAKAATVTSPSFSTLSPNELLLAFVATDYLGGANTTVTSMSGGGLTWTLVLPPSGEVASGQLWRPFAAPQLTAATVTASLSQSVVSSITVLSFTGVDTTGTGGSGAIGATKSASASTGAPTAGVTTTRNSSWVFGVWGDFDKATARTPGAGQSLVQQYLTAAGDTYWVQKQNSTTPLSGTSVTINDTAPTTDRYNLSIVEVLPASAPPPPTFSISGTVSGAIAAGVT